MVRTWSALLGDPEATTGRDRNLVWQVFDDRSWPANPCDRPLVDFQRALVADLRALVVTHPADIELHQLIDVLRARRPTFGRLWDEGNVGQHRSERKKVTHPRLGDLVLDCDVLQVPGSEVRILVYSVKPGSQGAERPELLTVSDRRTNAN